MRDVRQEERLSSRAKPLPHCARRRGRCSSVTVLRLLPRGWLSTPRVFAPNFFSIATTKLFPALFLMVEPLPQFGAGRDLFIHASAATASFVIPRGQRRSTKMRHPSCRAGGW